jgi:hypothetical protein
MGEVSSFIYLLTLLGSLAYRYSLGEVQMTAFPWRDLRSDRNAPLIDYLLGSLGVCEFLTDFWAKRPLYIRGNPDKFAGLFSIRRLSTHLQNCPSQIEGVTERRSDDLQFRPVSIRASYDRGRTHVHSSPLDAMAHYDCGATLCVEGLDSRDDDLAMLAQTIRRELTFIGRVDVRVYLSPDRQGFDTHFDSRIATTLQIEGAKRWKYSEQTAVEWPPFQVTAGSNFTGVGQNSEEYALPVDCTFREVILERGDILCLPAGCWHSAEAIGHSLALNLAFSGTGAFWGPVLMSILSTNPRLRAPAPPVIGTATEGAMPSAVEEFLERGIQDLLEIVTVLSKDRTPLKNRWLNMRNTIIGGSPGSESREVRK